MNQVFRICLRVMVSDVDAGVCSVVYGRIVKQVLARISYVGRKSIFDTLAELSMDNSAEKHLLDSGCITRRVVKRISRIARKVHTLAIHGCVLATKGTVEALLKNLRHRVRASSMEECLFKPAAPDIRGALVLLA